MSSSSSQSSSSSSSSSPSKENDSRFQPTIDDESQPKIIFEEADVDRQLEWHQARLNSKLNSDMIRSKKELLNFNRYDLFRLSLVRLIGSKSTRPQLLKNIFSQHLNPKSSGEGNPPQDHHQSLSELLRSTDELYRTLANLGIFSHLEISLNSSKPSQEDRSPISQDSITPVEAIVRVVERSKFFLKTSTDIGNGEGALTGLARSTNFLGHGEMIEASAGLGSSTRASCQLRSQLPIWAAKARFEVTGFACERDLTGFASCNESLRGISTKLRTQTEYGNHELGYELSSRSLGNLEPSASTSIREAAGEGKSLKSSLSHLWSRDSRDNQNFPRSGNLIKLYQEYAGLGGDAKHFKSTIESSVSKQIFNSHNILTLGFQAGLITSVGDGNVKFNDRFQLGGPTSVRMFKLNSLGPRDGNDHLGGQFFWATGLSLLTDIPKRSDWPLKFHSFINAGKLSNHWSKMINGGGPSVSCGIGLVGKFQDVRLEVNLGLPLSFSEGDGARRGLQVGLGIGFLS